MRYVCLVVLCFLAFTVKAQAPDLQRCLQLSRYYAQTQPDSAVDFANKGIHIAEGRRDELSLAELLFQLGEINAIHSHKELARGFYNESLGVFRHTNNHAGLAKCYDALGVLDNDDKDFKLAEQSDGYNIDTYVAQGKSAEAKGETEKAISYYLRALTKYTNSKQQPDSYFDLLQTLGRLYVVKGKPKIAIHYLQEGIRDSLQQGETGEAVHLMEAEGETLEKTRDEKDALSVYKQALADARKFGKAEEQAEILLHIANVLKTSDTGNSIADLNEALRIVKKVDQPELETKIYAALAADYRQQKNYGNALFAIEEQHRLLDSLLAADTIKEIKALDTSYALERSHEKVIRLEAANRNQWWLLASGLLVLSVITALLILLWRSLSKVQSLNTELSASNKVKDTLFSVIGHDLKGPAASALQLFELLEEGDVSQAEMKALIGDLRRQTNASLDLLQALFEWGRSQLQGIQVNATDFYAADIVNRSVHLLARQAAEKRIQINIRVPDQLKIHADVNHFEFVIRNLLANAIKFSYPGNEVTIMAENNAAHEVVVSVADHGIGISRDQVAHFQSASLKVNFGTQKEKGSGLGLLLAKDFIKANAGNIWLESTEGAGSKFSVALPMA